MRRILIDHARKAKIEKIEIEFMPGLAISQQRSEWLMALDVSLSRLADFDPRGARIVEMTFFVGLTQSEVAEVLDISTRTVRRDLASCILWISKDMGVRSAELC
jgi:RNA polymerase sigma factor (sigma-70 family)